VFKNKPGLNKYANGIICCDADSEQGRATESMLVGAGEPNTAAVIRVLSGSEAVDVGRGLHACVDNLL
jgi:ethanolamine utilization microcompartment shell protein EutL